MEEKSKIFYLKFPGSIIRKAVQAFRDGLDEEYRDDIEFSILHIKNEKESWHLDNFDHFLSEYENEITSSLLQIWSSSDKGRAILSISYNSYYKEQNSDISVSLPTRDAIEKVFDIFENYLSSIKEQREERDKEAKTSTRYSYEKKLPSLSVVKSLIVGLENFILRRATELTQVSQDKASGNYHIDIEDKSGVLKIAKIADYNYQYFPDDIQEINMRYDSYNLEIRVRFSNLFPRLYVTYLGNSASEVVTGMAAEIFRITESYKTKNYLFNPSLPINLLLAALALVSYFISRAYFLAQRRNEGIIVLGLSLVIFFFLLIPPIFKKYFTFETKRNINLQKWVDWFVYGILGFLIFGVIGGLILNALGIYNTP